MRVKIALPLLFVLPSLAAVEPPLMMIRLRAPHTADDAQWAKTFKVLRENRGACDEVWLSTGIGFPKMAWHEAHVKRLMRYAEQLRSVGIVPSLQVQATLGHDDSVTMLEGVDGKTWVASSAKPATARDSLASLRTCARWRGSMPRFAPEACG